MALLYYPYVHPPPSLPLTRGAQFAYHRAAINALVREVAELENVKDVGTLAQHIETRYEQTIGVHLHELRELLKSNGVKTALTASSCQLVPPAMTQSDAAWLLRIEEGLSPTHSSGMYVRR